MLYGNIYTMAARLTGPKKAPEGEGYTIAGESYQTSEYQVKKKPSGIGETLFLTNIGKQQFIHDAIDYSQFPVIACTAGAKRLALNITC